MCVEKQCAIMKRSSLQKEQVYLLKKLKDWILGRLSIMFWYIIYREFALTHDPRMTTILKTPSYAETRFTLVFQGYYS
jgi:hypothetical protein